MPVATLLLALSIASVDAQDPPPATSAREPRVEIEKRSLETRAGDVIDYEVGTLFVPENRAVADSRTIGIGFLRIRADEQPASAPPVFVLPGGPGGSYVTRIEAARGRRLESGLRGFGRYRGFADVVLVDQRGYSGRGDRFVIEETSPKRPADRPLTVADEVAHYEAFAASVVADYAARDVDLRGYTVVECAHDVADLSAALGYDRITLQGTSFGSQWSFAIMRLHPGRVARALLSGVEPLDHGYDMPSDVFAALQRMWRAAESDPRFEPFLPPDGGGIAAAALAVIERLEREPFVVTKPAVAVDDGEPSDEPLFVLGPDDFPWWDPAQILELYHGHVDRWQLQTAMRGLMGGSRDRPLIGPLIDTSLGVTPERRERLWHDPATRFVRRRGFASYLATAEVWPSPDVGDELRTPVLCDIPVVFAQGTWDLKTPLENTFEIAPFFVNSRVLIAERGGHGVLDPISRELPDVWAELVEFVRTGDLDGIPARVELEASRRFTAPMIRRPRGDGEKR